MLSTVPWAVAAASTRNNVASIDPRFRCKPSVRTVRVLSLVPRAVSITAARNCVTLMDQWFRCKHPVREAAVQITAKSYQRLNNGYRRACGYLVTSHLVCIFLWLLCDFTVGVHVLVATLWFHSWCACSCGYSLTSQLVYMFLWLPTDFTVGVHVLVATLWLHS